MHPRRLLSIVMLAVLGLSPQSTLAAPPVPVRYQVPDGNVDELVSYIESLRQYQPTSQLDRLNHSTYAQTAVNVAAQRILKLEPDSSSRGAQIALRCLLEFRAREIRHASSGERSKTIAEVKNYLKNHNVTTSDLAMATAAAAGVEALGEYSQAAEAYSDFAEILSQKNDPTLSEPIELMRGTKRRLTLMGEEMSVTGTSLDGKEFDLSAYRGKVVLINFWGTWCRPCRFELPNIIRRYKEYHSHGFEVVGICVDEDRDAVIEFLRRRGVPWVNLYELDAGRSHPVAVRYGVVSYPTMLLVGKDGRVMSLNARGHRLRKYLEQIYGAVPKFDKDLGFDQNIFSDAKYEQQR